MQRTASTCFLAALTAIALGACDGDGDSLVDTGEENAPAEPDAPGDPTASDPTIGDPPTGDTVAFVEVPSYLGTWYEIASIPQGFQRSCTGTTATYDVIDERTVSVLNKCFIGSLEGDEVSIEGSATIVDDETNAKLAVDFGFGGTGPAPYWIVDLALQQAEGEPYRWAVVSNPDRSALWILNREPSMPQERLDTLLERLEAAGYEPGRLSFTAQPE